MATPLQVRATVEVGVDAAKDEVLALIEANPFVQKWTVGKEIKKRIYVPGKICNLVVV
jgi:leucyl-tRNA synthetase